MLHRWIITGGIKSNSYGSQHVWELLEQRGVGKCHRGVFIVPKGAEQAFKEIRNKLELVDAGGSSLKDGAVERKKELQALLEAEGLESLELMKDVYALWIEQGRVNPQDPDPRVKILERYKKQYLWSASDVVK